MTTFDPKSNDMHQRYTLFISDCHLSAHAETRSTEFLGFLTTQASQAEALYILGDFFDVWIGDDDDNPFNQQIIHALKKLTNTGMPVYFMEGNRDLLIGKQFFHNTGIKPLKDPTVIQLYHQSVLLTHGDYLCTQDWMHQIYRRFISQSWVKKLFLSFPLSLRRKITGQLRRNSQRHNQKHSEKCNKNREFSILDVTPKAVIKLMEQHHAALLIHGHTHRPAVHSLQIHDQAAHRIVLGSWHDGISTLKFYEDGQFSLTAPSLELPQKTL